jgi:hypothetical protein
MERGMRTALMPHWVAVALLCAVVLATRLPFLGAGYGWHADNWRTALAARHIAESGVYEASRFPGYPVQEYVLSRMWRAGPWAFNFMDALFATVAVGFFAMICADYGIANWWAAGLTLAFAPIVYVNSVSSKDFPWALGFLMGSWWFAMRKRPLLTGVFLGLAVGVRITSGAAALPIALILIDGLEDVAAIRRLAITAAAAAIIGLGAFVPVYGRYGWGFLDFYASHGYPGFFGMAARMTTEVWGVMGFVGICVAFGACFLCRAHSRNARNAVPKRHLMAWWSMLVIYVVVYACLPDEAAYLMPALPFALLLIWWAAPRWAGLACCGLMVVSPFLSVRDFRPVAGLLIQDHRDRVSTDGSIENFLHFAATVSGSNAYIVGSWKPPIDVLTADSPRKDAKFVYLLTQAELEQAIAQGWSVWYLGEPMRFFEVRTYGYDVAQHGARDIAELMAAGAARGPVRDSAPAIALPAASPGHGG